MATAPSAALAEVERLYREHNPEKVADVPKLAAKYGDAKLLAMVRKKYGAAEVPSGSPTAKRQEIDALYAKHNPEKLGDVEKLVAKYGEDKLLAMVRKKYRVGQPAAGSPSPQSPPPKPEPTGKAAAAALQEHIRQHGTQDVKTIDRLRRASLQPDSPNVSAQQAQMSEAAAMAAAMAEVDGEEEEDEQQTAAPPSAATSAKRQEIDALYAKHNPEKLGDVEKLVAKYGEDKLLTMVRKKYRVGQPAAGSPSPQSPPPKPEPTGKAAAAALQEHIRQHGTQDVKKIDRLRRASLQPDSPNVSAQQAQMSEAAAMAAAMAEVDGEEEEDEQQTAAPPSAATSAKRQEIDALYAKHNPEKLGDVEKLVAKYGEDKLLTMVRKKYRVGQPAAGSPSPQSPPPKPEPTGKAAAAALQEHIRQHGTQDVKKIDRLRRASLQPDSPNVSAQQAQMSEAAAMAAAMAEVDGEEEEDEQQTAAPPSAATSAKRQEIDALYAKHNPEKLGDVEKLVAKYGEDKLLTMVRKKYRVGQPAAGSPSPQSPPPKPEPTGKAAAAALQEHIRQHGTQDVKKIDRLRRASLQPDSPNVSAQQAQMSEAAAMAAAMAEVDGEEEEDEQQTAAPPSAATSAKRQEIDALYAKHNPEKLGDVEKLVAKYGEDKLLTMVRKKYRVGQPAAGSPSPQSPPPKPEPTGKAAAAALQEHIRQHGTQDVKKIDRLRRASLQPDSPNVSAQQAQMSEAAAMAAAMAEVDGEEEEAEGGEQETAAAAGQDKVVAEALSPRPVPPPRPDGKSSPSPRDDPEPEQPSSEKRQQIERLYMRHNPAKLDELDDLLARFGEVKLLAMVKEKYGDLDPQERIAEVTYLLTQKQEELRKAIAAGGTHNMTRIDQLRAEQQALQEEKQALENPSAAGGRRSDAAIDTTGMSPEEITRLCQKLDLEAKEQEQSLQHACAEEMREINAELAEAKKELQTYVATHGTADMSGTLPLTEQIQQLESLRADRQRETNKQTSKIQADLERKKMQLRGGPAAGTSAHSQGTGGRRASISERMLGSLGLGPEAASASGEMPKPTALRRLSVSLTGGAQAAQQEAAHAAKIAAEEKRKAAQAERQKAAKLAEQGRKIVVRKELTTMYRKYCPERLSELESLIEQHGADEVMKMTRQEFQDEIKDEQVDLIFDFLGVVGTDVSPEEVALSFENAGYSVETWVQELKDMHANGELADFLGAIKRGKHDAPISASLPDSTQSIDSMDGTISDSLPDSTPSIDSMDGATDASDVPLPASSAGGSYDSMDDIAAEAYSSQMTTIDDEEEREMQELQELEGLNEEDATETEEPVTPSSRVNAFSSDHGFVPDTKYDCKLAGKSVKVIAGGMGLQVFPKKGTPTTYIYQTLLGWTKTDDGFQIDTADGKLLEFQSSAEDAQAILQTMGKHALKLAKVVAANKRDAQEPSKPIKLDSMQSEESSASPEEVVQLEERKIQCKLGGKSVQVSCGGMGLQVFPKRGAPTTYIYQTLLGWMATEAGFEVNTADGQTLFFECSSPEEGEQVSKDMTAAAQALAKAQQDADRAAGIDLNDAKRLEGERMAKARMLAEASRGDANVPIALDSSPAEAEALGTLPLAEEMTKYDCKLSGKSVQVAAGGMGLQIFGKKGVAPPTTYIYQTLKGWNCTEKGADIETVDGKHLTFAFTHDGDADKLVDEITNCARELAKAQRNATGDLQVAENAVAPQQAPEAAAPAPETGQRKQAIGVGHGDPATIPKGAGFTTAIEPAETRLQEAVAVGDTVSSWRQSLNGGGGGDLARQWGADDRACARLPPLVEELVLALPPVVLAGSRSSPTPRVANLCAGTAVAASAVLRAYPNVSMTLVAADEDALFSATRQVRQQLLLQQQLQQQIGGWGASGSSPVDVSSAVMAISGSYDTPIEGSGGGGYDVIVAAQSLRELLSPERSSLEDNADDPDERASEMLVGYRWLFAKVLASLSPGGTFLVADETDTLGLYGHMRLMEETGFAEIDCAWRQGNSFVCGGTKPRDSQPTA